MRFWLPTVHCMALVLAGSIAFSVGAAGPGIVETALEHAAKLRAEGRFDEALDALRAESRKIKAADGDESPRLLPINDLAAEILIDNGDLETAASLLGKTISAREKIIATGNRAEDSAHGSSLLALARLETTAKRLPAAIAAGKRALLLLDGASERDPAALARAAATLQTATDVLADLVGPGSDAALTARDEVAALFTSLGMIPEAIEQRRAILAGLMQNRAVDPKAVLQATDRLGRLMMTNGRAAEAIPVVETTLPALGAADAHEALAARRLLGELQLAAGTLSLAEASFAHVLEVTQRNAKHSPIDVAGDRLRSLLVAARRGAVGRLPDWFDATVKTLSRPAASELTPALSALALAARVKEETGDPLVAVEWLGRALTLASAARSPDACHVADLAGRLAAAQLASGDAASARKTAERALPAAERDVGRGSAEAEALRLLLADALARAGNQAEALALAAKALDRGLPRPDDPWEKTATAICDRIAATEGKPDLRDAYLAMRARQFGPNHAHVVAACGFFGAARLAAGDWPAASDFFQRAVELDPSGASPETAANLTLLARAQQAAGDHTQAVETAVRGLAAWERVAGAHHPGTLAAADVLVAAKVQAGDIEGVPELLERLCASDAADDPARRAAQLVRLADITAAEDKVRAKELLRKALQLPCWQEGFASSPRASLRLAFTAALATHAFRAIGDETAATQMLQRARGLVMQSEDSAKLLARIERLATHGDGP